MGNVIYIIPYHDPWQNFFDSLSEFTSDYGRKKSISTSNPWIIWL